MKLKRDYRENAIYHLNRKMAKYWRLDEISPTERKYCPDLEHIRLIGFSNVYKTFDNWLDCYNFLKDFTKSNKRKWLERVYPLPGIAKMESVIWDTDLEPIEQYAVDCLLEFFDYEKTSFEIEELAEIITENIDDENLSIQLSCLISALQQYNKKTIEVE